VSGKTTRSISPFETPKITFKNLEVLDAFVKKPSMRFDGKRVRAVHLSEQG
jgi:hypothetical protein